MNWLTNLESAKEEASVSQKPVLLQFEMPGCGGCKKLYEETYTDEKTAAEMSDNFVLLKVDLIKDREIRRQFSAYWTPSIYFLDHTGKSYFYFNGYLPPGEFRIILRLGYAETMIPKGKYDDAYRFLSSDLEDFSELNPLLPKLLASRGITDYIRTKDKSTFMRVMKDIQIKYPSSLEAKMYFWNE
ncbi:MAG: thioredoxin family protein [Ignavibacteriaceae bacterium]|nr:thioredoxin family protein [Ignavibacteriaceae bacterium]